MTEAEAIELVKELIIEAEAVRRDNNLLNAWRRKGSAVLDRLFGDDSKQARAFLNVDFRFRGMRGLGDNAPLVRAFNNGIEKSKGVLQSCIWEIEHFGLPSSASGPSTQDDLLQIIGKLCERFHAVARQLRNRYDQRPTLVIEDEYDVQDLLHALLRLYFDDVRPEECTPSYAGKAGRMDFLLKDEQIVIEVKKTRKGLGTKELGDQLAVDIARYQSHPDCKMLVCFVYDPDGHIGNPRGIERDLARDSDDPAVRIVIYPR